MAPRLRSWPGSRRWRVADRGDRAGRSSGPAASGLHDRPLVLRGGSARPARGRGARGPRPSRSTSSPCACPARRRPARSTASGSGGSTSSAIRAPACGSTCASTLSFLVRAGWAALRAYRSRRYRVVQVHSLPDFLVFAALPLKLAGAPGHPGPPRGDAGVLPDPLPERAQPARPPGAPAPGAAVDPVRRPRPVGQRARWPTACSGSGSIRPSWRSCRTRRTSSCSTPARIRAGHSEPTARCGSSTPAR